jgi:hypothetical protein
MRLILTKYAGLNEELSPYSGLLKEDIKPREIRLTRKLDEQRVIITRKRATSAETRLRMKLAI